MKKALGIILAAAMLLALLCGCSKVAYDKNFEYSDALDDNGFFKNIQAEKYVTLPEYKNISIQKELLEVSESDLNTQIDQILSESPAYERILDRAVEDGDTVNIDYVGSVDGVEFAGGSTGGNGTVVTIGVTTYIDDFLEQLIGHTPGETINVEVTFPDSYPQNQDLAGKDALFVTTINYIQGEELEVTELTDEIAKSYGFETKDELIEDVSDWIIEQQKLVFFNGIIAEAECKKIPDAVLNYIVNRDLKYYNDYASSYGMSLDDFMKNSTGYESVEAYIDAKRADYEKTAVQYLAIQAIAEKEGLSVTMEDIAANDMDTYIDQYGVGYIKQYLLQSDIVPNWVADNAIPE